MKKIRKWKFIVVLGLPVPSNLVAASDFSESYIYIRINGNAGCSCC